MVPEITIFVPIDNAEFFTIVYIPELFINTKMAIIFEEILSYSQRKYISENCDKYSLLIFSLFR